LHRDSKERLEQSYGVAGEVLVAIWGLETDYGVNIGKFATVRSLATLAYECRRAETFRAELMDALRAFEPGVRDMLRQHALTPVKSVAGRVVGEVAALEGFPG